MTIWDFNEQKNYVYVNGYKVINSKDKIKSAKLLDEINKHISKTLFKIVTNEKITKELHLLITTPYVLQEMQLLKDQGSIKFDGLNKPKNVYTSSEEKIGKDGILRAEYRLIFLKLKNNGKMSSLNELKPLIAHELAHTAANHVTWRDDDHGNVFNKNYNIIYKHI